MSVASDHLSSLRTLIVRTIREQTGLHERLAVPLAEEILRGIQAQHGGGVLTIPARSKADRYQAIRDAHAIGVPVSDLCVTDAVDRSTVYRALRSQSAAP